MQDVPQDASFVASLCATNQLRKLSIAGFSKRDFGRVTAFLEAGADCLYAPALPDLAAILIGLRNGVLSAEGLAEVGVRRISVGGALVRAAYGEMLRVAGLLRAGDLPAAMGGIVGHGRSRV